MEEYLSKHLPMAIPAMSPRNSGSNEIMNRVRRELGPQRHSIHIKDPEELMRTATMLQKESGSDDDDDDEPPIDVIASAVEQSPEDNAEALGQSRNRKRDRILRGSKSNLDYTKNVLKNLDRDRNTSRTLKDRSPNKVPPAPKVVATMTTDAAYHRASTESPPLQVMWGFDVY